jgi:hypothetical protein
LRESIGYVRQTVRRIAEMLYVERITNSPWALLYGEKRDVLKFRPFGCRAWMFLNKDRREKGKTAPRAVEVVNLGFASDLNTSAYKP